MNTSSNFYISIFYGSVLYPTMGEWVEISTLDDREDIKAKFDTIKNSVIEHCQSSGYDIPEEFQFTDFELLHHSMGKELFQSDINKFFDKLEYIYQFSDDIDILGAYHEALGTYTIESTIDDFEVSYIASYNSETEFIFEHLYSIYDEDALDFLLPYCDLDNILETLKDGLCIIHDANNSIHIFIN